MEFDDAGEKPDFIFFHPHLSKLKERFEELEKETSGVASRNEVLESQLRELSVTYNSLVSSHTIELNKLSRTLDSALDEKRAVEKELEEAKEAVRALNMSYPRQTMLNVIIGLASSTRTQGWRGLYCSASARTKHDEYRACFLTVQL